MVPMDGKVMNQTVTMVMDPDGAGVTLRLQVVYHSRIDKWLATVWNAASGECLVSNFPLVGSYKGSQPFLNDLLSQFGYMGIGSCVCYCIVERPSKADPAKSTLDEYELLWGDYLGEKG